MTEAMPFLQKYDITFLRPLPIQGRGDFLDMRPNDRKRKEDSVRGVLARVRQASAAGGADRAAALPMQ